MKQEGTREPRVYCIAIFLILSASLAWCLLASSAVAAKRQPLGPFGSAAQPTFPAGSVRGLAIETATGDLLVLNTLEGTIERFAPDGTPVDFAALGSNAIDGALGGPDATPQGALNFGELGQTEIAVDNSGGAAAGHIYVTQGEPNVVNIFSGVGKYLGQLTESTAGPFTAACGVTVDSQGSVYVGDSSGGVHKFSSLGGGVTNADNSENFSPGFNACQLAAGAAASSGWLFASALIGPVYKVDATGGALQYEVTGGLNFGVAVDPLTGHVLTATSEEERNEAREFNASEASGATLITKIITPDLVLGITPAGEQLDLGINGDSHIETYGPISSRPVIASTTVKSVGTGEAVVGAILNAEGLPTTYHFEYGPSIAYGQSTPERSSGSSDENRPVTARFDNLAAGTIYHWRLVATNSGGAPVVGPDRVFTTYKIPQLGINCANQSYRSGPSQFLFDCRAYELVTPQSRARGDVITQVSYNSYSTALDQSASGGDAFTFSSYRADADAQAAPYSSQALAHREANSWTSTGLNPPREAGSIIDLAHSLENEYTAFSTDLSVGLLFRANDPALSSCAPPQFPNIYRSRLSDRSFDALICQAPASVPTEFIPELQGFSSNGAQAVFRVAGRLTSDASNAISFEEGNERPVFQVYEGDGTGNLKLVSVLPSGEPSALDASAGTLGARDLSNLNRFQNVESSVSNDGERVYWSNGLLGPLFLRNNVRKAPGKNGPCGTSLSACTVPVSEKITTDLVQFQGATPSGERALFSVINGPFEGNLYRFDLSSEEVVPLASGVIGHIVGASRDLSRVTFVSDQAPQEAEVEGGIDGVPSLYQYDGSRVRYVAALSAADLEPQSGRPHSLVAERPINRIARVSPDGVNVVFRAFSADLSQQTARYDNTDPLTNEPAAEVYVYDAGAGGGAGKLRCISCNPSGANPLAEPAELEVNRRPAKPAAATIPTWQSQLYNPRYLSDDGHRVFFDAFDALSLEDTNGAMDVYEWEEQGAGECNGGSSSYVPASEGCLNLISSGKDPSGSEFLDASQNGSDVFFKTAQSLVPQDSGLVDVYDARVGGGFPPPPAAPSACEGEGCQGAAAPPAAPNPTSERFQGPGNAKKKKCSKGKALRKGKCVARHAHKKKHHAKHKGHGKHKQRSGSTRRAGR